MDNKVSSKSKLTDIISLSQLKKKFKAYLVDKNHGDFKSSIFPRNLVVVLVMILEDMISDSLEYVIKNEINGLYVVVNNMIKTVICYSDKYDLLQKYLKKYNNVVKYQDSLFFNIKKVVDNLESKYGSKLMVDPECRNFISYLLLSIQYEFTELSIIMVDYANRKTLNKDVLNRIYSLYLNKDLSSKIKLRLDSMDEIIDDIEDTEDCKIAKNINNVNDMNDDVCDDVCDDVNANANTNETDETDETD